MKRSSHLLSGGLALIGACLAASAAFGDAVMKKSEQTWNSTNTNLWQAPVPTFGPGVTVAFGMTANQYVYYGTNVTVGALVVPDSVTPGSLVKYQIYPARYRDSTTVDPTWNNYKWQEHGNTVTFDSGTDEPAVLGGLVPLQANRYRMLVHVPIRMASDLKLTHLGVLGMPGSSSGVGEYVSLAVLGPISDDGTPHLLITDGPTARVGNSDVFPAIVIAGRNTFTGDVDVRAWTRLMTTDGDHLTPGRQLGYAENVYVTNACGMLDLNGGTFPERHHLHLGGFFDRQTSATATSHYGRVVNTYPHPVHPAVWKGPVTITAPTAIGAPLTDYPFGGQESPVRFEGDVDDSDGHAITLQNVNGVTFSGTNTFHGEVYAKAGYVTFEHPESFRGRGRLRLSDSAIYRMTASDQSDLSAIIYTNTPVATHGIRLRLEEGVVYEPQCGFTNFNFFYKTGPGTFVWKTTSKPTDGDNQRMGFVCAGGETVFDYSVNDTCRLHGHSWWARPGVANGGRLVFKTNAKDKSICGFVLGDYSTGEIEIQGPRKIEVGAPSVSSDSTGIGQYLSTLGVLNVNAGVDQIYTYTGRATPQGASGTVPGAWNEMLIWSNRTWIAASASGGAWYWRPFTAYTNNWSLGKCFIDVTPALLQSSIPSDFSIAAMRFNTPFETDTVTLTLSGKNSISSGTILVTPDFGANKTIRFTGGSLTRPEAGPIRIVSFATNTTIVLDSDLVQSDTSKTVHLLVCGCKVRFTGTSGLTGNIGLIGGELEVWNNGFMGGLTGSANLQRHIFFNQGGRLTTHGDFSLLKKSGNYSCVPYLEIYGGGGTINVADGTLDNGTTVLSGNNPMHCHCFYDEGVLSFTGAGHFNWTANVVRRVGSRYGSPGQIARYRFACGRVTLGGNGAYNFGEAQNVFTVENGVTLTGANAFNPNLGGINGGGSYIDSGSKTAYEVGEGGVSFDVAGTSREIGKADINPIGYLLNPYADYYSGTNAVVFTNSSTTTAYAFLDGLGLTRLTGRIVNAAAPNESAVQSNLKATWINFPHGIYELPYGKTGYFWQMVDGYQTLALGGIAGRGMFGLQTNNTYNDPVLYLGRDADETVTFDGQMRVSSKALGNHASTRIVKVGTNRQRFTNADGIVYGATRVANGDILIACEPTGSQKGALGPANIYLCDAKSPENAVPRVLTDGPYTLANEFRILAAGPSSASPFLGGASETEDSTFTGAVKLWRDLGLYSAGGTVTFAGQISNGDGNPHVLSKAGPGTVVVSKTVPTVSGLRFEGGTLRFDTAYTVPDGATVSVSEDLCVDENIDKTLELLSTPYGMTGEFAVSPALPDGWVIRQKTTGITLSWGRRGSVIIIR